jgi:Ca2+-binding EF-hand superfamily protein
MNTLKKITIATLAVAVAGTALGTTLTAYAQGGSGWGRGFGGGMHGARFMERFDLNGDGLITQEEANDAAAGRFAAADADSSGGVTLEEFKAAFAENSKDRKVRAFQRLDKDGDGAVTKEEFEKQTDRLFARLDRNDDDTLERLRGPQGQGMGRGPGQGRGMGQGMGQGQGPRWQSDDSDEDARGRGPGMGPRAGQGEGHGPRWGRDDDGWSGHRWGMHGRGHGHMNFAGPMGGRGGPGGMNPMGMLFDTFDTDSDGKITRSEFEDIRGQLFASADSDGNGSFDLDGFSSIWTTLMDGPAVRMFQGMDKDGDLTVTAEEHAERSRNMIERMDRNDDGVISKADFKRGGKDCGRGGRGHHGHQGPRHGDWGGRR